jgi:hypothetical protein
MDLTNASRAPKPQQRRRLHAPAENQLNQARCGAKITGQVVENNADPELTTCLKCRRELHVAGILPYVRQPRP